MKATDISIMKVFNGGLVRLFTAAIKEASKQTARAILYKMDNLKK